MYAPFSDASFWFTVRLLTEPWEWLVDFSTKANVSFLTQLKSQIYLTKKYQIEKAVSTLASNIKFQKLGNPRNGLANNGLHARDSDLKDQIKHLGTNFM